MFCRWQNTIAIQAIPGGLGTHVALLTCSYKIGERLMRNII